MVPACKIRIVSARVIVPPKEINRRILPTGTGQSTIESSGRCNWGDGLGNIVGDIDISQGRSGKPGKGRESTCRRSPF